MAIINEASTNKIDIQNTPSVLSSLNSILLMRLFLKFFRHNKADKSDYTNSNH